MSLLRAIQIVSEAFPVTLGPELLQLLRLVNDLPGGYTALPGATLTAALEALAFGGSDAGPYPKRWAFLEAAVLLHERGERPARADIAAAVGMWSAAIGRAAQSYRGLSVGSAVEGPAMTMATTLCELARQLEVLTRAAELTRRQGNSRAVLREEARQAYLHVPPAPPVKRGEGKVPPSAPKRHRRSCNPHSFVMTHAAPAEVRA